MGVSTDAMLYFGFDFCDSDSGEELPFEREDGWEEAYAKLKGLIDDSALFTDKGEYAVEEGAERDRRRKIRREYTDARDRLIKETGVRIDYHCHPDFPIWFVCLENRFVRAHRGSAEQIVPLSMQVSPEEIQRLREVCEILGIEWKDPCWNLASYWG